MLPLPITAYTATSCMGRGLAATRAALAAGRTFLAPCRFMGLELPTWTGEVAGLDEVTLAPALADYDCRNNRLAALGLGQDGFAQAVARAGRRYGADRVGVFVGSSTSGLLQTELAYRQRDPDSGALPASLHYAQTHNMFSLADYLRRSLALSGPASVVSVACASSAKVFASAARAIEAGIVDAALVGGVDTLCLTTLYGFTSLELLALQACRPFDAHRCGISLGEAAAFALLERRDTPHACESWLAGFGESSDAHHMSSPHPQGRGAQQAMAQALARAGLDAGDVDYINLHGTATPSNDRSEDVAVAGLFGDQVAVSSTKGTHGHTLGAAGALEAVICLIALSDAMMPGGLASTQRDPALRSQYLTQNRRGALRRVMSNSFGFGGANCALVFSREAAR